MKSTTNFETFDFIQYMSMDVLEELNDLEELIEMGSSKGNEIRAQYNHINNLLHGIDYTLDYIADEEDREFLKKAVENMRELLKSRYKVCESLINQWKEENLK